MNAEEPGCFFECKEKNAAVGGYGEALTKQSFVDAAIEKTDKQDVQVIL